MDINDPYKTVSVDQMTLPSRNAQYKSKTNKRENSSDAKQVPAEAKTKMIERQTVS